MFSFYLSWLRKEESFYIMVKCLSVPSLFIKKRDKQPKVIEGKKDRPVVAIVDDYSGIIPKSKDLTHGELVEKTLKATCPTVDVIRFDVTSVKISLGFDKKAERVKLSTAYEYVGKNKISATLDEIAGMLKSGKKIDAVNISLGASLNLFPQNLEKNVFKLMKEILLIEISVFTSFFKLNKFIREKLKKEIKKIKNKKIDCHDLLNSLENLAAEEKAKIFVSAGNEGCGYINSFSLAKNVITVGSCNAIRFKKIYSSPLLADRYEHGVFRLKDGKMYPLRIRSNFYLPRQCFKGTSLSTPVAVGKYLKKLCRR